MACGRSKSKASWRCALKLVLLFSIAIVAGIPEGMRAQQPTSQPPGAVQQQHDKSETAARPKEGKSGLKRVHVELSGFELDKSESAASNTQIGGGTRGADGFTTLLAPRFSRLYSAHPVFHWTHTAQAQSFEFRLLDEKGDLLYKAHVSGREFRYPDSAPALQAGAVYGWNVRPEAALLGGVSPTHRFSRLPQKGIDEISEELGRIGTGGRKQAELRAELFTERRLWFDSVQALSELIAEHPEDAELYERRGVIYDQIGVTNSLAGEDFAVADQLRVSQSH
jgi:hypothetical protein